jgi:hypothetical protein
MELVRLSVPFDHLDDVVAVLAATPGAVVLQALGADTVVMVGALCDDLLTPVGAWLEVGPHYPPSVAARDVKTLSWLVTLAHVVISARADAALHAQVVTAMLSDDEVNLDNAVATIRHAYNRPAPPAPVTVWSFDGVTLRAGDDELTERARASTAAGEATTFA